MDHHNPRARHACARIRVLAEHVEDASAAFAREGLSPVYLEHRADGNVAFWFGKLPDSELLRDSTLEIVMVAELADLHHQLASAVRVLPISRPRD